MTLSVDLLSALAALLSGPPSVRRGCPGTAAGGNHGTGAIRRPTRRSAGRSST